MDDDRDRDDERQGAYGVRQRDKMESRVNERKMTTSAINMTNQN